VRLTLSATNLVDDESAVAWYFNFDPLLDSSLLSVSAIDTSAVGTTNVLTGNDLYMADGDGFFDLLFDFPPPPGNDASRFTGGETVIYDLTYIAPITVGAFDFLSEMGGGAGSFNTAAQILSIGPSDNGSGWIGFVPEPGTASLLALGMLMLAGSRRRSQR